MYSVKVVLIFLLSLIVMIQAAPRPPTRPPPHPCQYTCPRSDNGHNGLQSTNEHDNGGNLICTYRGRGRTRGGSCIYGRFTGQLLRDNDNRHCPREAGNNNHCGHDGHHRRDGEEVDDDVADDAQDVDDDGDDE